MSENNKKNETNENINLDDATTTESHTDIPPKKLGFLMDIESKAIAESISE